MPAPRTGFMKAALYIHTTLNELTGRGDRIGLMCGRSWVRTHGQIKPMAYKIDTVTF